MVSVNVALHWFMSQRQRRGSALRNLQIKAAMLRRNIAMKQVKQHPHEYKLAAIF